MTDDHTVDPQLLAELHARIHALEAWRTHQTDLLDELLNDRHDLDDLDDDTALDGGLDGDALIEWVHRCVTPVIARPLRGEIRWCPRWWEHPEAVFRFEALHRAWTELAPEPGVAMSLWIRDHLDPCLRELLSPLGPFVDCTHTERRRGTGDHTPLPTLPTSEPR
ncbi:DUF4913 domain-containing protein [Pseudonocardia lacus]|uniref:DUF4913 domain-containing protein n=1 Tax=Pseudonocardia lacus TaxID=2835865 RepID=UPI001BDCE03E|nr:DUF4913 domain-containing protein [Pseudonocardia lacus]